MNKHYVHPMYYTQWQHHYPPMGHWPAGPYTAQSPYRHPYMPVAPVYPVSMPAPASAAGGGFFNFGNPRFIKGALIGALATYILTNEKVQQGAIRGAVKAWSMVQGGVEEMKERFRDAEAELHAGRMEE